MRRYIIHLLPAEPQRRAYDALRARVAAAIGPNRALDYPTAHVTLVQDIQDDPGHPTPIDPMALRAALDRFRGHGALPLPLAAPADTHEHLLLPLADTSALVVLRQALHRAARAAAAGPGGAGRERAARVHEQTWPHLTIAQEIDPERWERGAAILAAEGSWLREPVLGAELALVARDLERGEPYRIAHRVPLIPPTSSPHAP